MSRHYLIYVRMKPGITREQVEKKLDLGQDWIRYQDQSWIVRTTSDAKKWYARLRDYAEPGGQLFVCRLDPDDYWGYMPTDVWAWLKAAKRNEEEA